MAELEFGVRIIFDGMTVSPVSPVVPHPENPDPPRGFAHRSTPTEITISWSPPLDWGDERSPSVNRYYEIRYRRNTNPDDQTDNITGTSITIPARGGTSLTLFGIRAVNAANRKSVEIMLPNLEFAHYSRIYAHQYGPQYA